VRRHAKASIAVSTNGQVNGRGRNLAGPLDPQGIASSKGGSVSAVRARALLVVLTTALSALAFGAAGAYAAAPAIPSTFVTAVSTNSAVLEADIETQGESTTYHFEYGPADCSANPCTAIPVPDGNVGSASSVRVKQEINGLTPDTVYHFRTVATNPSGTTQGPDRRFTTYPADGASTLCPNSEFRYGQSATLPDCRAFEMVSPIDKNGGDITTLCEGFACRRTALNQSATDGRAFTYSSYRAFADAGNGRYTNQYLAKRQTDGWATHALSMPQSSPTLWESGPNYEFLLNTQFAEFSPDLSTAWVYGDGKEPLTPDAVEGYPNIYRQDTTTRTVSAVTINPPLAPPANEETDLRLAYEGTSADGNHTLYAAKAQLTANAAPNNQYQLYDFTDGEVRLVSILPSGEADPESSQVGGGGMLVEGKHGGNVFQHAISDNGSRIFWTSAVSDVDFGKIYVRRDGTTTVPVSESVSADQARFVTADPTGSTTLFEMVTGPLTGNLYQFDVDSETPALIAGDVVGVAGTSEDLSHIYFVSSEALDAGASVGEPNLYLYFDGAVHLITILSAMDTATGGEAPNVVDFRPNRRSSRVTPDGRYLVFTSTQSPTGYDNTDLNSGEPAMEVYRYDSATAQLQCISCNPSGARPTAQRVPIPFDALERRASSVWAAAWLTTSESSLYTPRTVSTNGSRIFFNSFDALVPEDANGLQDVYQWESNGTGTCDRAAGCIDLLSGGEGSAKSEFVDAAPDGSDVFFETKNSLLPQDPGLIDIYDARIGGGFAQAAETSPCIGDSCQSPAEPQRTQTPASATFRGKGSSPSPECGLKARSASRLARQAERLRKRAALTKSPEQSVVLRQRAARLGKRAKRQSKQVSRCRRLQRGASR
jgi:hypothetical protein